ncbi:MAG TPA: histidine kinase [Gemmatimonadaceae bacterium]
MARLRAALAIVAAWTVFGLLHAAYWIASSFWSMSEAAGLPERTPMSRWWWVGSLVTALLLAWTWALLTPLIFRVANQANPARVGWMRSLATHTVVFAGIAAGMTALRLALLAVFTDAWFTAPIFLARFVFLFDVHLFTYLAVVLTGRALASHRRYVDRALRAQVLETQLARAQLHFLELQLQPHFLFNSLNVIQELAHESPNAAERMLRRLHALLALSLERSGRDEVSLAEELAALEPYIDIQRARFDWLSVRITADDEARRALVPHLILQPLVENSIRHGLAVRKGPGHIDIVAQRVNDRLLLQVRDDGVGLTSMAVSVREGIGLRNATERLRQLYPADHRFELRESPRGGAVVEVEIPYREAPTVGGPRPGWAESSRSREAVPEITLDEITSWRTGEFEVPSTPIPDPPPRPISVPDESTRVRSDTPRPVEKPAEAPVPMPLLTPRGWLALVAVVSVTALMWIVQIHVFSYLTDGLRGIDGGLVKLQLGAALFWFAISIGVFYLARRFRLSAPRLLPYLAIHLVAAVVSSFGFLWALRATGLSNAPIFWPYNINPLTGNFFVYFGLVAWAHARDFVTWYRQHEITTTRLTTQIARSRFQALCVQVRPQFLLGTLDLLARLVHVDVPRADVLVARLADVLRLTLDMAREHTTTLQKELQLVAASVEAHRLGIRPAVTFETEIDPDALGTPMPSRLLCTMVDDLLAAGTETPGAAVPPLAIRITAERGPDATRVRLHGESQWTGVDTELHAWWRKKSAAEAALAGAGPLVTVAFPDRTTAVLIVADEPPAERAAPAAA